MVKYTAGKLTIITQSIDEPIVSLPACQYDVWRSMVQNYWGMKRNDYHSGENVHILVRS
jgi:hypothetical protein